jgi:uncharacterized repeat protein (TIGR01451 family)
MHELGHALGLFHGGGQGIPPASADNRFVNDKPNYLSVMNYSFQSSKPGFALRLPGVPDRSLQRTDRPLNYSAEALLELEEDALLEGLGIVGPAGGRTRYGGTNANGNGVPFIGPTDNAIDWNANGRIDAFVSGDINFFGVPGPNNPPTPGETLLGHDDWANLVYNFRDSFGFKGGTLDEIPEPEQTIDDIFGPELTPPPVANLAISKTSEPAAVHAGENIIYHLTVANLGPDPAANVVLIDTLPATTTFISCSATGAGTCSGSRNDQTITFPSLESGLSVEATLVGRVNDNVPAGTIVDNTASVSASTEDSDPSNNQTSTSVKVIAETPPPTISNISVDKPVLWPPNHKLVRVTINYTAASESGTPSCSLSVTSNEPPNGAGDGNTTPDWQVLDEHHVNLRAERSGQGKGRIYTVTITCRDSTGASASKSVEVIVPKSSGA